ncbi:MAG: 2Fe-2S iron-sulfur cluster-binding protein [Phycisphaerae bacterium]|jgi:2Fe-2S ferredoxin
MPRYKVTFQPIGKTVEVDPAKYPYGKHGQPGSLLDIALAYGVDLEHACGGVGICGTCHIIVTAGAENLTPAGDEELDMVDSIPAHTLHSRLACQAVVRGDVTVTIAGRQL